MDWYRLLPSYWIQNTPTNMAWDRKLNALLDEHGITKVGYLTVMVGDWEVWAGNYPYAYGHPYNRGNTAHLPRVATRKRLARMIEAVGEDMYD